MIRAQQNNIARVVMSCFRKILQMVCFGYPGAGCSGAVDDKKMIEFAVHSFRSVLDCGFRGIDFVNLRHIEFRLSLIGIQPIDLLLNVVKLCVAEAEHGRILQERFGQSLIACNKLFLSLRCVAVL